MYECSLCECMYKLYLKQHPLPCHVVMPSCYIISESLRQPEATLAITVLESVGVITLDIAHFIYTLFQELILLLS